MTPLTPQQIDGLHNAPRKITRQLAHTAATLHQRNDELAAQLRQAQEELAAAQLAAAQRILVILHRNGSVDLWAQHKQPVHFVCLNDLGRGREDEAENEMLGRLPLPYRELFTKAGNVLASGTCRGCMDRTAYELWKRVTSEQQMWKMLEKEAKSA